MWFLIRSALLLVASAIVGSLVVFLLLHLLGGDVATIILGKSATPESVARLRTELGLDKSWGAQYVSWLGGLLRGDLGESYAARYDIFAEIQKRLSLTLTLALVSMVLSSIIAIAAGTYAALHSGTVRGGVVDVATHLGMAVPTFWASLVLVTVFSIQLGWLPAGGYVPWTEDPVQALRSLILPVVSLSIGVAAVLTRYVKSAMLEVLSQPYIRTAMAKGRTLTGAALVHGIRNASVSIVTVGTLLLGGLLAGTIITEFVFNLPGLGSLLMSAINGREALVVQSVAFVILLIVLTLNFLMDIAYSLLDPRIRDAEKRGSYA